jgi:glycosyltransferase involved in cell wall biosynthesis
MKVLQVIPGLAARTGGPAISVVDSSLALRKCGVEVNVFTTDLGEASSAPGHSRARPSDLPRGADELDINLFPARWPYRLAFSPALRRALATRLATYDVVHIHSLFLFPQYAAYREATRQCIPYVVSPCGALDPYLRSRNRRIKAVNDTLWQRRMLDSASAIHYKTDDEARLASDLSLKSRSVVVPNGIRVSDFENLPPPDAFRTRHLSGHSGRLILFLGRLSHKKGLDILIRAFADVRKRVPDAMLVIAGPDDEGLTVRLKDMARLVRAESHVVFVGMLDHGQRMEALAAADVWALPSHTENFGNAALEAIAAGLPTIMSPAVNIAVDAQAAGAAVIAELTPQAFAEAIVRVLGDDRERAELSARGREFAERYDWARVAPRWAEMYSDVIACS